MNKLVLTGFMATGKSAVGRCLAARLGRKFFDTDHIIVRRAGCSIERIFAIHGEAHFRALERAVIKELALSPDTAVIATGGGSLVDEVNYWTLAPVARIVCLVARPEVIAARLAGAATVRPKLAESGLPLKEAIARLMEQRAGAYARIGTVVDSSELTIAQTADRVIQMLEA
ncbi:MAG TPA: shikimate kinase [Candidatus Binataceae bacterium]|nr:shikimate kinase [Candidatus Binataceae bacterium]